MAHPVLHCSPIPMYTPEMAAYVQAQLQNGLIAICEEFSTDTDSPGVQCMFDPIAVCEGDDPTTLDITSLWTQDTAVIDLAGKAYFATNSNADLNTHVKEIIEQWTDEVYLCDFKVFYFAHAVVVAAKSLDGVLDDGLEELDDHDAALKRGIRICVDADQSAHARIETLRQVEDFVRRYIGFSNPGTDGWAQTQVVYAP